MQRAVAMFIVVVVALAGVATAASAESLRQPLVIAHRGASQYAPENTLAAVHEALRLGADAVEVDVQLSRDRVPVLLHDVSLARTTDVEERFPDRSPWHVDTFTVDELRTLDAGSWKGAAFTGERIPTLDAVLDAVRGRAALQLELKVPERHPGIEAAVASSLTSDGTPTGPPQDDVDVVVQSFDRRSAATFAQLQPTIAVAQLVGGPVSEAELRVIATYAEEVNPWHADVDAQFVDAAHDAGLRVNPYTVDAAARIRRLLRAGVDGVITDRPDVARRVVDG